MSPEQYKVIIPGGSKGGRTAAQRAWWVRCTQSITRISPPCARARL